MLLLGDFGDRSPHGKSQALNLTAAMAMPTPKRTPASTRFEPPSPNANVNPETTMATSDGPRAMVLVKACCRTLTAFSHGEFACAKAGTARARVAAAMPNPRASNRKRRTNRERRFMEELLVKSK